MPHSGAPTVRRGSTLFVPLLSVAGFFLAVVVTSEFSSTSQTQVDLDHLADRIALEELQSLLHGTASLGEGDIEDLQIESGVWSQQTFRLAHENEIPTAVRVTVEQPNVSLLGGGSLKSEAIATYLPRKIVLIRHNLNESPIDVSSAIKNNLRTLPGEDLIENDAQAGLERALISGLAQLKTSKPNDQRFQMLIIVSGSPSPPLSNEVKTALQEAAVPVIGISLSPVENQELAALAESTNGLILHAPASDGPKELERIIDKISKTHPLQLVR